MKTAARGKKCNYCQNFDHFEKVCMKKAHDEKRRSSSHRHNEKPTQRRSRVAVVDDRGHDGDADDSDASGSTLATSTKRGETPTVKLILLERKVRFVLDTGADITIINKKVWDKLRRPPLSQTSKRIFAYKQLTPLQLSGKFVYPLIVPGSDRRTDVTIYVAADETDDVNILSHSAAKRLGLVSFSKEVHVNLLSEEMNAGKLLPIGKMKGVQAKLYIDPNVPPVVEPYRPKSLHFQQMEMEEVKALEELDIIETVSGPTSFVSNTTMALKPGGKWRYCVDARNINKAILRIYHPLPTVDQIINFAAGYQWFSVLDLNSSYHQIELEESSRPITAFHTPLGLRQFKRLFFGLNCAGDIFLNIIREKLQDLDVLPAMDDFLIRGKTIEEHDSNLEKVRQRLIELNLTTKENKDQIRQQQVDFWGLVLSSKGVRMDSEKVKAIQNCSRPENQAALKSFIGMINYCARFIKGQADLVAPLRELSNQTSAKFVWSRACERAFLALQQQLSSKPTLAYFDVYKRTELIVDASPTGLGAILSQIGDDGRSSVVAYASKVLSPTQRNYSQIEREFLAVVWGC